MPIFYPDNENRARRVQELVDDISNLQQTVINQANNLDNQDKIFRPTLNKMLSDLGLTTFDQLVEKVKNSLPDDQKAKYQELIDNSKNADGTYDDAMLVLSIIIGSAGAVILIGAPLATFIAAGGMTILWRTVVFGMRLVFTGRIAEGATLLARSGRLARGFAVTSGLGEGAMAPIRAMSRIAKVIAWAAFALDVIVVLISAIQGAQQRDALQKAIIDLFARRLLTKLAQVQADSAVSVNGLLQSYVLLLNANKGKSEAELTALLKPIQDIINQNLEQQKTFTFQTVYAQLETQDKARNSWTNEDPSYADTMTKIQQIKEEN